MLQSPSVRLETEISARMRLILANLHFKMFGFLLAHFRRSIEVPHYFCIAMFEPTGSSSTPIAERQTRM